MATSFPLSTVPAGGFTAPINDLTLQLGLALKQKVTPAVLEEIASGLVAQAKLGNVAAVEAILELITRYEGMTSPEPGSGSA